MIMTCLGSDHRLRLSPFKSSAHPSSQPPSPPRCPSRSCRCWPCRPGRRSLAVDTISLAHDGEMTRMDGTYDLLLRHAGEARVLRAGLAALGSDVLDFLLAAVGEVAWVVVAGHVGGVRWLGLVIVCWSRLDELRVWAARRRYRKRKASLNMPVPGRRTGTTCGHFDVRFRRCRTP